MISAGRFLDELATAVPESSPVVEEHLTDNEGLLLHPLMSDLLRLSVSMFEADDLEGTDRLLGFVDRCLREGDDVIVNAVAVSYVEDFGAHPGESDALLARWPSSLRDELGR